jgi:ribonuclease VapC
MFLETSALVEYFIGGPDYERVARVLDRRETPFCTSPTVLFEAATVLAGKRSIPVPDAAALVHDLLAELNAEVLSATRDTASIAIDAFARYGKGRHPAKLNFGDCFSYAGARQSGLPLLYVGGDFARTDLA